MEEGEQIIMRNDEDGDDIMEEKSNQHFAVCIYSPIDSTVDCFCCMMAPASASITSRINNGLTNKTDQLAMTTRVLPVCYGDNKRLAHVILLLISSQSVLQVSL